MFTCIHHVVGASVVSLALFAPLPGQAQAPPSKPADMLKWCMARYAKLTTYHADCTWSETYGGMGGGPGTSRAIWYKKPNLFKVVSTMAFGGMVQTSVSDGARLIEYATGVGSGAQRYAAPPSIADAASMQMKHPMFCGSLLYRFFGGPGRYSELVDEAKQPVTFGATETLDGQACRIVKFYAQGPTYGKTEVAIGKVDGLVHRIKYGSEPLMKMMQSGEAQAAIKEALKSSEVQAKIKQSGGGANGAGSVDAHISGKGMIPTSSITTERYLHITVDKPIDSSVFNTKTPAKLQVSDMGGGSEPRPPVALGSPAPAVNVTGLDGVKHTLADFKGKVVLIDFWATWCPPCRKGLPETQRLYSSLGHKGLAVLTVSDERKATVEPFLKQNKYTFPAYLDTNDRTNKAYKIAAIPTVVVIDRSGNLVAYKVGLSPPEEILAALKKAGLAVK